MSIRIHPIKAFNDNYIWTLINENNKQAIVIDPGQAEPVIAYLEEHELELTSIWTITMIISAALPSYKSLIR